MITPLMPAKAGIQRFPGPRLRGDERQKPGFARDKLVDTPDGISLLMVRNA